MTPQNYQANGGSLEDCYTNLYALTDLGGIKWRTYTSDPPSDPSVIDLDPLSSDPLSSDPVLQTYARCLQDGLLCTWTKVPPGQPGGCGGGAGDDLLGQFGASIMGMGGLGSTTPALSSQMSVMSTAGGEGGGGTVDTGWANKKLWVFWYGEHESGMDQLLSAELRVESSGSYEDRNMVYECRVALFKALATMLERNLLSKSYIKMGTWFIPPSDPDGSGSMPRRSFSVHSYFVHGDSTVCVSVDMRIHRPLHKLNSSHLKMARASAPGHEGQTVTLAPFGMSGQLQCTVPKEEDVQKTLREWEEFYPIKARHPSGAGGGSGAQSLDPSSNSEGDETSVPLVVEVVVDGKRMFYPSVYVLVEGEGPATAAHANKRTPASRSHAASVSSPREGINVDDTLSLRVFEDASRSVSSKRELRESNTDDDAAAAAAALSWGLTDPTKREACGGCKTKTGVGSKSKQRLPPPTIPAVPSKSMTTSRASGQQQDGSGPVPPEKRGRGRPPSAAGANSSQSSSSVQQMVGSSGGFHKRKWLCDEGIPATGQASSLGGDLVAPSSVQPKDGGGVGMPAPSPASVSSSPATQPHLPTFSPRGGPAAPAGISSFSSVGPGSVGPGSVGPGSVGPGSVGPGSVGPSSGPLSNKHSVLTPDPGATPGDLLTSSGGPSSAAPVMGPPTKIPKGFQGPGSVGLPLSQLPATPNGSVSLGEVTAAHLKSEFYNPGDNDCDGGAELTNDMGQGPVVNGYGLPALPNHKIEGIRELKTGSFYENGLLNEWLTFYYKDEMPSSFRRRQLTAVPVWSLAHPLIDPATSPRESHDVYLGAAIASPAGTDGLRGRVLKRKIAHEMGEIHSLDAVNGDVNMAKKKKLSDSALTSPLTSDRALRADMRDLDNLFQDSDDESELDHQSPPRTSSTNLPGDDHGTSAGSGSLTAGGRSSGRSMASANTAGPIGAPELTKMYPTPPSIEHHHGNNSGNTSADSGSEDTNGSHVFVPPECTRFISSVSYKPVDLPSLVSSSLGDPKLPSSLTPWLRGSQSMPPNADSNGSQPLNSIENIPIPSRDEGVAGPSGTASSISHSGPGGPGSAASSNAIVHLSNVSNPISVPAHPDPSYTSYSMEAINARVNGGTGSAAVSGGGPVVSTAGQPTHLAALLQSPASNASLQYPPRSVGPRSVGPRSVGPRSVGGVASVGPHMPMSVSSVQQLPEVSSVLVNLALSESLFNVYRDRNFDSSVLCVCNLDKGAGGGGGASSGGALAGLSGGGNSNSNSGGYDYKGRDYGTYLPVSTLEGSGSAEISTRPCFCAFSAVVNRRLGICAGLLYEDEVEVAGRRDSRYDKLALRPTSQRKSNGGSSSSVTGAGKGQGVNKGDGSVSLELLSLVTSQFSTYFPSISGVKAALSAPTVDVQPIRLGILLQDKCDIVSRALEYGQLPTYNGSGQFKSESPAKSCVSKWEDECVTADMELDAHEELGLLKSLTPLLQESVQKKRNALLWENPYYKVSGPITWKDFHKMAGRGGDESCEPQPIPSMLVGARCVGSLGIAETTTISPLAIKNWDHLLLRPAGPDRDIAYVAVVPDSLPIIGASRAFFDTLSRQYESCGLGRHRQYTRQLRESILRVGMSRTRPLSSAPSAQALHSWFDLLGDSSDSKRAAMFAFALRQLLAPIIREEGLSSSTFDTKIGTSERKASRPLTPMGAPSLPGVHSPAPGAADKEDGKGKDSSRDHHHPVDSNDQNHQYRSSSTPYTAQGGPGPGPTDGHGTVRPRAAEKGLVIYMVDPFSFIKSSPGGGTCREGERKGEGEQQGDGGSLSPSAAYLGMLKSFQELLAALPADLSSRTKLQVVPLQDILCLSSQEAGQQTGALKSLCFSAYAQFEHALQGHVGRESITGFGPTSVVSRILKKAGGNSRLAAHQVGNPPFVLAPYKTCADRIKLLTSGSVGIAAERRRQARVLFCSYCPSEDQRWLIVSLVDECSEMKAHKVIDIHVPDRSRRKKATVRRHALTKVMEFVMETVAATCLPWRLVIGRLGRLGHGELKAWALLLRDSSLTRYNRQLHSACDMCAALQQQGNPSGAPPPSAGPSGVPTQQQSWCEGAQGPAVLTACLTSLEANSSFAVRAHMVRAEEKKASNLSLGTPQDVSVTHILVIPNSTTAAPGQDLHSGGGGNDQLLPELTDVDDIMGMLQMGNSSPTEDMDFTSLGLVRTLDTRRSVSMSGLPDTNEENAQLLNQPLATGYLLSTAPTGPLPGWFWASCPWAEKGCPTNLKSALHFTSIVQSDGASAAGAHPLESTVTCDILRYVLEVYSRLSWMTYDPQLGDRRSCLPVHMSILMNLYHAIHAYM